MFYGRENELRLLKDNYDYHGFKMIVLYGRRRVGKSFMLQHFFGSIDAKTIAFQAVENSTILSIEAFKDTILNVFPSTHEIVLDTWKKCFSYLNDNIKEEKVIICIDEINYIFKSDDTFASQLQDEIDNHLKDKNVLLIVCGSNVSSIEDKILNTNSPLYARRNLSIKLQEFNYLEASDFYPNYSNEDKTIAYAIFGGKGKSLAAINPSLSIKENVIKQILTPGGSLADEIDLLLKDDFRDPTFYKELLYVMSLGNTTFNDISTKMNVESSKVATYLSKLIDSRIIEKKEIPGNNKKNDYRYYIQDNFFSFYFRFVYKKRNILNILVSPEVFYERFVENDLYSYIGLKFENICEQYIIRQSYFGFLDFIPLEYGKYYGKHRNGGTFDIDVFFKNEKKALCGECKFTNAPFTLSDMEELINNSKEVNSEEYEYYVFSKSGVTEKVIEQYPFVKTISLSDLYR